MLYLYLLFHPYFIHIMSITKFKIIWAKITDKLKLIWGSCDGGSSTGQIRFPTFGRFWSTGNEVHSICHLLIFSQCYVKLTNGTNICSYISWNISRYQTNIFYIHTLYKLNMFTCIVYISHIYVDFYRMYINFIWILYNHFFYTKMYFSIAKYSFKLQLNISK